MFFTATLLQYLKADLKVPNFIFFFIPDVLLVSCPPLQDYTQSNQTGILLYQYFVSLPGSLAYFTPKHFRWPLVC